MKLRDKFWLWGHPEGRYNYEYGNNRESRMTPMAGCLYLGVRNTFMVPVGWEVDRRMFGCYLYNFGERKQATGEAVTWQLDWYREKILAGEAEGVVLHTNTMADLDYEAYDAAIRWMNEHGDEEI